MMALHLISIDQDHLLDMADFLLNEDLISNAIITPIEFYKEKNSDGKLITQKRHLLKAITKTLLFSQINTRLREKYPQNLPLIYSEPIILIDAPQREVLVEKLVKV